MESKILNELDSDMKSLEEKIGVLYIENVPEKFIKPFIKELKLLKMKKHLIFGTLI